MKRMASRRGSVVISLLACVFTLLGPSAAEPAVCQDPAVLVPSLPAVCPTTQTQGVTTTHGKEDRPPDATMTAPRGATTSFHESYCWEVHPGKGVLCGDVEGLTQPTTYVAVDGGEKVQFEVAPNKEGAPKAKSLTVFHRLHQDRPYGSLHVGGGSHSTWTVGLPRGDYILLLEASWPREGVSSSWVFGIRVTSDPPEILPRTGVGTHGALGLAMLILAVVIALGITTRPIDITQKQQQRLTD